MMLSNLNEKSYAHVQYLYFLQKIQNLSYNNIKLLWLYLNFRREVLSINLNKFITWNIITLHWLEKVKVNIGTLFLWRLRSKKYSMELVVSSPGKVILHGEHSVVYGKVSIIFGNFMFLKNCTVPWCNCFVMSISYLIDFIAYSWYWKSIFYTEGHCKQLKPTYKYQIQRNRGQPYIYRFFGFEHQRSNQFCRSDNNRKEFIRFVINEFITWNRNVMLKLKRVFTVVVMCNLLHLQHYQ